VHAAATEEQQEALKSMTRMIVISCREFEEWALNIQMRVLETMQSTRRPRALQLK